MKPFDGTSRFCSHIFGNQLDIHSGGVDLAFPHHENEMAQSEAYHQCRQWANYFLHSGTCQESQAAMENRSSYLLAY